MSRTQRIHLAQIKIGNIGVIAGIFLIALVSFGLMYLSIYILPLSDKSLSYGLITIALIAIGLAAPFLILKVLFHEAHLRDWKEKEFHLHDIPKDKQQLEADKSKEKD